MELVTSDAHQSLPLRKQGGKNAIAAVFAGASWQRCRTHFMANLLTRVPKRAQPGVATMVRTIYQLYVAVVPWIGRLMAELLMKSAPVESGAYAHPRAAPLLDAGTGPAHPGRHAGRPWLFARLTG